MMIIFMLALKILCILLAVLLGLVMLVLLAMVPRAGIRLTGKDGSINLWVRYGQIRLHLYPLPKRAKKTARAPKKAPPEKQTDAPKESRHIDLGDTICLVLGLLDDLRHAMRIDILHLDAVIATGDAARTGTLLGMAAALSGMITPVLQQSFDIPHYHIYIDGDFQGDKGHWQAEAAVSVRPIRLLWALARRWRDIFNLFKPEKTEAKT